MAGPLRGRAPAPPSTAAAGRPVHPVSALGVAVLVSGFVLAGVGWYLGWAEATVMGMVLLVAWLLAVLLTAGRSTYAVELDLSDHRITVGQRAVGRLVVTNTSTRRLLPAQIELPVGEGSGDFPLPSLAGGASHEDVFAIPTTRRAVVVVGPVRSVRGDPLGLLRRRVRWTDPVDLFVHPEIVGLGGAASGVLRDLEGQATRVLSDSDMSFHALRDYVAGDDRRHIHWKTSARIGELMVRQFEDTRRTHTAVVLSTATEDYTGADDFELAVAVAASVGVQALRDERDLTVLAGTGRLPTGSPALLLDATSGLVLGEGTGTARLVPWALREAADASAVLLITGTPASRAELRSRASRLPVGLRTVVLGCAVGAPVEVATQGALSVAQLGALTDLPRLMRRVVGS